MDLEHILSQVLELTGSADPRTFLILFAICSVGEFGLNIPFVLESFWLMVGYQFGRQALTPVHVGGYWLAAQAGRQIGGIALYHVVRAGAIPLGKFYTRHWGPERLSGKLPNYRWASSGKLLSLFSTTLGRLWGMRIPFTITLALKKKPRTLSLGIMFSSLIWDLVYIFLGGTVGATATLGPVQLLLISLAVVAAIYLIVLVIRRVFGHARPDPGAVPPAEPAAKA